MSSQNSRQTCEEKNVGLDIVKSYLAIYDGSDTRPGKFFTEHTKSSNLYHHSPRDSYRFLKGKIKSTWGQTY